MLNVSAQPQRRLGQESPGDTLARIEIEKAIRCYPIRKVTTPVPVEGAWRWRTAHERRHLAPWAQKAEQIGVPLSASVFMGAANVLEVV
jgi:hypothetical protein